MQSGRLLRLIALCAALPATATAHVGSPLSGTGTAVVDGIMGAGEWDGAARLDFLANLPGGGTTPATLLVMNDATNLYLAARVARDRLDNGDLRFEFDNDHDAAGIENGDDFIQVITSTGGSSFYDSYRTNQPPCPPGSGGWCGFSDTEGGGTLDGQGNTSNDGSFSFYELSHPLDSTDDLHDFSLAPGAAVGFYAELSLCNASGPCANTAVPEPQAGDIAVASADALTLSVANNFGGTYHAGYTVIIAASMNNPGIAATVDLFFGVLLPDRHTILFFRDLAFHFGSADLSNLAGLTPLLAGVDLSTPFGFATANFFSYEWSGYEPAGSYSFFLLAAAPDAFADNSIDPGDVVALSTATLSYSP